MTMVLSIVGTNALLLGKFLSCGQDTPQRPLTRVVRPYRSPIVGLIYRFARIMIPNLSRRKVQELEKKQKNFDKILVEEKLQGEKVSTERDNAERDAREKETTLLRLNRGREELQQQLSESERSRKQWQIELEDLVNIQDTADKNVHELEKAKRQVEQELAEQLE